MALTVRKRFERAACMAVTVTGAVVLCASLPGQLAHAQSTDPEIGKSLTLGELEAYIAAQREELEKVMENRTITESKAEALEEALAEREARQREVEAELQALCEEREEIEPGSLDTCLEEAKG